MQLLPSPLIYEQLKHKQLNSSGNASTREIGMIISKNSCIDYLSTIMQYGPYILIDYLNRIDHTRFRWVLR